MEAEKPTVPKTPHESDPRKENRTYQSLMKSLPAPRGFRTFVQRDDGTVQTIKGDCWPRRRLIAIDRE
jgi:hypothetical protein